MRNAPALAMDLELDSAAPAKGDSVFPSSSLEEEARATGDIVTQLWAF